MTKSPWYERLAPIIFVALWSTGFIVARYSTDDSEPLTFLCVRMFIASILLWVIAAITKAPKMSQSTWTLFAVVGIFMHAIYLGGVFIAIDNGLPSGLSALIAGLHPVVTSIAARLFLSEKISRSQIVGIILGVVGVSAVIVEKLLSANNEVSILAMVAMAVSLVGLTIGTLLQRAYGKQMPLLRGTATQYLGAGSLLAVVALFSQSWSIRFTRQTVFSMTWSVGVLSLGAVLIMMVLLARHSAAQVSSLFFLTPALSTVQAAVLFGERLGLLACGGLVIAMIGVRQTMRSS